MDLQAGSTPLLQPNVLEIQDEPYWSRAGEVLQHLRPTLDLVDFSKDRSELLQAGYRLLAVRQGEELLAVAGIVLSPHVLNGKELIIKDMVTCPEHRGKGHSRRLLEYVDTLAVAENCYRSFVHTKHAAAMYEHCGYQSYSTGLIKDYRQYHSLKPPKILIDN